MGQLWATRAAVEESKAKVQGKWVTERGRPVREVLVHHSTYYCDAAHQDYVDSDGVVLALNSGVIPLQQEELFVHCLQCLPENRVVCPRCGGGRVFENYMHIAGGVCFACKGDGSIEKSKASGIAPSKAPIAKAYRKFAQKATAPTPSRANRVWSVVKDIATVAGLLLVAPFIVDGEPDGPPKAGQRWTEEEDEQLRAEFEAEMSVKEIAEEHERTQNAIHSRLKKLGLVDDASKHQTTNSSTKPASSAFKSSQPHKATSPPSTARSSSPPPSPTRGNTTRSTTTSNTTSQYRPWTKEEEALLRSRQRIGTSVADLAELHNRTQYAIAEKLKSLARESRNRVDPTASAEGKTALDDAQLHQWRNQGLTATQIAKNTGQSPAVVSARLRNLDAPHNLYRERPWNSQDDASLRAYRSQGCPAQVIADKLCRSVASVSARMTLLKL